MAALIGTSVGGCDHPTQRFPYSEVVDVFRNWAVIGLLVIDLVLATVFVYGWATWDPESGAVESIAAFVVAPLAISLAITALTIIGLLTYRYAKQRTLDS